MRDPPTEISPRVLSATYNSKSAISLSPLGDRTLADLSRRFFVSDWKSAFAHLVFREASMLGASNLEEEDWNVVIVYLVM